LRPLSGSPARATNPEVTPQHLLVALLEQDGGIVVPVLRRAGADPERVRRRVNEALDALPTVTGEASAPALGQGLIGLLQAADDEARGLGDEYVSTEHLLLALAGEPRSTPAPRATSSPRRSSRCAGRTA
jgi:ATP-dependent Clp protease ATP-binding subunit ClpB